MGRRCCKKVSINEEVILHQLYIYRAHLLIASCDLTRSHHPCLLLIMWDSTEKLASRPLAIQQNGTWYTYGWDLTKNTSEIYNFRGYIETAYCYSPFGVVFANGNINQPMQWNGEFFESELSLSAYINRFYNPQEGRWLNRDKGKTTIPKNLYRMVDNSPIMYYDLLGNDKSSIADEIEAKRAMHKDPRFSVIGQRIWAIIRVHYEDDTLGFCDSVKSSYAYSRKHALNYDTAMEAFRNEIGNRVPKYYKDFIENRVAGNFVDYYTKMQIVKNASLGLYNVDGELKDKSSFNITLNWGLGKTISAKFESLIYASNNNSNIAHYLSQLDFYEAQKVLFKKPEIGFDDMASVALSIGYDYSRQLENNQKLKFNCGMNAGSDETGRKNAGVNASVIYEMGEKWHIHASGSLNWNENFLPNVKVGFGGNF